MRNTIINRFLTLARRVLRHLRQTRSDLLLTALPAILWLGTTYARPLFIQARCASTPQACSRDSVPAIDQLSLGMEDMTADGYSYQTQNFSGFWGITLPWGWTLFQTLSSLGSLRSFGVIRSLGILAANLGSDLVVYLQTISWNGLLTEISHIVSQRPRPFVFSNPTERGIDPAHYTSFYSGHTSFAAATGTCGFLLLMRAGAPLALLLLSFASTQALILSTAYFRILAGRHFLTDVLCGAIAGSITAYCLARRKAKKPIQKNTHGSKREAKLLTY